MSPTGDFDFPRDYVWRADTCRCPQCKPDWSFHPMQQITDAPSIVPDMPSLREHVSDRVFDGVRPIEARDVFNRLPSRRHRPVVAFTGLAGSGKSTAAAHLANAHGFARLRFAGPLKDMMRALGLNEREIEGDLKERPCDLLGGKTPRWAMQTIGTEWGRNLIASDLWIRAFRAAVDNLPPGKPVVVDDCRFPNESDAVRSLGGALVRIVRAGAGTASTHSSEGQELAENIIVPNDGTIADLFARLDHLLTSQVVAGEFRS